MWRISVEILWNAGLQIVIWFQALGGWLAIPMRAFSFLGQEEFFLVGMPFFYWCLDGGLGFRVAAMLLLSVNLSCYLKIWLHSPRPFWYSTQVKALSSETTFGLPSAHAQNAAGIWGLLAALQRRRWLWIVVLTTIFAIGISRIYLGMHFPTDVLAGWLIGFLLAWVFLRVDKPISNWLKNRSSLALIGLGFASSLAILGLFYLSAWAVRGIQIPFYWIQNANSADPAHPMNPLDPTETFTTAGVWFGMALGATWLRLQGGFDARGPLGQRALRYLIGLAGVGILYAGLGRIFPRSEDLLGYGLRYLRYTLIGAWVAGGAPLVFIGLGLAQSRAGQELAAEPLKLDEQSVP
jgi:membrane-associated phospholipid phosphatase